MVKDRKNWRLPSQGLVDDDAVLQIRQFNFELKAHTHFNTKRMRSGDEKGFVRESLKL